MFSRSLLTSRPLTRSFASSARRSAEETNALLLLEHRGTHLVPATLNAITAARALGGKVTGLIVGEEGKTDGAVEEAKK